MTSLGSLLCLLLVNQRAQIGVQHSDPDVSGHGKPVELGGVTDQLLFSSSDPQLDKGGLGNHGSNCNYKCHDKSSPSGHGDLGGRFVRDVTGVMARDFDY